MNSKKCGTNCKMEILLNMKINGAKSVLYNIALFFKMLIFLGPRKRIGLVVSCKHSLYNCGLKQYLMITKLYNLGMIT